MEESRSTLDILSSLAGEYLSMKTDALREKIVSCILTGFNRILVMMVMVMLLMIVLTLFAFGFILLLGNAIGSWSGAAFIVGGIYLTSLLVIFLLRKKLYKFK